MKIKIKERSELLRTLDDNDFHLSSKEQPGNVSYCTPEMLKQAGKTFEAQKISHGDYQDFSCGYIWNPDWFELVSDEEMITITKKEYDQLKRVEVSNETN